MFDQAQSFPCPNCKEFINSDATVCRFCSQPVDPAVAAQAAADQEKINQACNDASMLRNSAAGMWLAIGLSFIPFLPVVGWASWFLFIGVFGLSVRWQFKYGGIRTQDPDFAVAKRNRLIAFVLWLAALVLFVVLIAIVVIVRS